MTAATQHIPALWRHPLSAYSVTLPCSVGEIQLHHAERVAKESNMHWNPFGLRHNRPADVMGRCRHVADGGKGYTHVGGT